MTATASRPTDAIAKAIRSLIAALTTEAADNAKRSSSNPHRASSSRRRRANAIRVSVAADRVADALEAAKEGAYMPTIEDAIAVEEFAERGCCRGCDPCPLVTIAVGILEPYA